MATLVDNFKGIFDSYGDKQIELIVLSLKKEVVDIVVDMAIDIVNCYKITPLTTFMDNLKKDSPIESNILLRKLGDRYIIREQGFVETNPCIIFADFNGTSRVLGTVDYYERIDRGRKYRDRCLEVIMYNHTGFITSNGFWIYYSDITLPELRIIFLKRSKWAEMIQTIPKIDPIPGNPITYLSNPGSSEAWINNVTKVIRHILSHICDDESLIDLMMTSENMEKWTKMFMHPTFNYIYNYELYEYLGDRILSAKFDIYMCSKYERLNKQEASNFHSQYLSKFHQYYISEDMKLPDLVIYDKTMFQLDIKYKTDLLESFFTSLFLTAQSINYCFAEVMCMNLTIMLGESLPFEKKMIFGLPKHRVTQVLQALKIRDRENKDEFGISVMKNNHGKHDASTTLTFYINNNQVILNKLKADGKSIDSINGYHQTYSPFLKKQEEVENFIWNYVSDYFEKIGLDLTYTRSFTDPFITELERIDHDLYIRFVAKLDGYVTTLGSTSTVDIPPIRKVSFKSDTNIRVLIMYFNTYEVPSVSGLLTSITEYVDPSQLAGSDYIEKFDRDYQIVNLGNVKIPDESAIICHENLDTISLAKYYLIKKFTEH